MPAPMASRRIEHRYDDPVAVIWLDAAARLGMHVVRSDDVYASWDGAGTLSIAESAHFDADDSLAQMIFHEICHALVAGDRRHQSDWGLTNDDDRDLVFEHATHRLQAALAAPHGLRDFLAVTTDWRPYWDGLPRDPLADGDDPAIEIAQRAHLRSTRPPWQAVLNDALHATAKLADMMRPLVGADSLWSKTRGRHRTGFLLHDEEQRCSDCAWSYATASGRMRCRRSKLAGNTVVALASDEPACEMWEAKLSGDDCGQCGACCREGFDLVQVRTKDRFLKRYPELVSESSLGLHVARPSGRCRALHGDGSEPRPFRCAHYADRPRACAEFPVAGEACLLARRRVGLSK